jgi:hypothetical protein
LQQFAVLQQIVIGSVDVRLVELLGWVDVVPSPRRGYPPHWVVNPAVHQKFEERAKEAKERRERGREMAREISAAIKSSKATPKEE